MCVFFFPLPPTAESLPKPLRCKSFRLNRRKKSKEDSFFVASHPLPFWFHSDNVRDDDDDKDENHDGDDDKENNHRVKELRRDIEGSSFRAAEGAMTWGGKGRRPEQQQQQQQRQQPWSTKPQRFGRENRDCDSEKWKRATRSPEVSADGGNEVDAAEEEEEETKERRAKKKTDLVGEERSSFITGSDYNQHKHIKPSGCMNPLSRSKSAELLDSGRKEKETAPTYSRLRKNFLAEIRSSQETLLDGDDENIPEAETETEPFQQPSSETLEEEDRYCSLKRHLSLNLRTFSKRSPRNASKVKDQLIETDDSLEVDAPSVSDEPNEDSLTKTRGSPRDAERSNSITSEKVRERARQVEDQQVNFHTAQISSYETACPTYLGYIQTPLHPMSLHQHWDNRHFLSLTPPLENFNASSAIRMSTEDSVELLTAALDIPGHRNSGDAVLQIGGGESMVDWNSDIVEGDLLPFPSAFQDSSYPLVANIRALKRSSLNPWNDAQVALLDDSYLTSAGNLECAESRDIANYLLNACNIFTTPLKYSADYVPNGPTGFSIPNNSSFLHNSTQFPSSKGDMPYQSPPFMPTNPALANCSMDPSLDISHDSLSEFQQYFDGNSSGSDIHEDMATLSVTEMADIDQLISQLNFIDHSLVRGGFNCGF